MNDTNNLTNVQPGTKLVYWPGGWERIPRIVTVERVTATQIIVAEVAGTKFRRDGGYAVGEANSYSRSCVRVPSDGEVEKVRANYKHHIAVRTLKETDWAKVDRETAMKCAALLAEQPKTEIPACNG